MTRVAILGRGAPLWLAAAALRRALGPAGVDLSAIELPDDSAPGDIWRAFPAIEALHNQIGIDEAALLRSARGAFTLGQRFVDASGAGGRAFLLPHGGFGTGIEGDAFFPHWLRARHSGLGAGLDDFSLAACAAHSGKLFLPDAESERYGRADYGYHLPAQGYAASLKAIAVHLGVRPVPVRTAAPERGSMGLVALVLEDGTRIEADLFVDTTREGALIRDALGTRFTNWAAPGDRILTALAPRQSTAACFSETRARGGGWTTLYPSLAHVHVVHHWSSADASDAEAIATAAEASARELEGVSIRAVAPGFAERAWADNVVAVGEAAVAFDPLHGLALHALQLGLVHLIACFPVAGTMGARRAEYNRLIAAHVARVRDFEVAYLTRQRHAGAFWDSARALPRSIELDHLVGLFGVRGEIAPQEGESLPADAWRAMLIGLGVVPEGWRPSADRLPLDTATAHFRAMLGFVRDRVARQPAHDDLLARIVRGG